jgi:hypothetical protein
MAANALTQPNNYDLYSGSLTTSTLNAETVNAKHINGQVYPYISGLIPDAKTTIAMNNNVSIIDNAILNSDVVNLPPGLYYINDSIYVTKSNVSIIGNNTTLKAGTNTAFDIFALTIPSPNTPIENVKITGLKLDGSYSTSRQSGAGILALFARNCTFSENYFYCVPRAIHIAPIDGQTDGQVCNNDIINNMFEYCGDGIFYSYKSNYDTISNNIIKYCSRDAINTASSSYVLISNNTLYRNNGNGISCGQSPNDSYGSLIVSNIIVRSGMNGILINDNNEICISNNEIVYAGQSNNANYYMIKITNAYDGTISENVLYDFSQVLNDGFTGPNNVAYPGINGGSSCVLINIYGDSSSAGFIFNNAITTVTQTRYNLLNQSNIIYDTSDDYYMTADGTQANKYGYKLNGTSGQWSYVSSSPVLSLKAGAQTVGLQLSSTGTAQNIQTENKLSIKKGLVTLAQFDSDTAPFITVPSSDFNFKNTSGSNIITIDPAGGINVPTIIGFNLLAPATTANVNSINTLNFNKSDNTSTVFAIDGTGSGKTFTSAGYIYNAFIDNITFYDNTQPNGPIKIWSNVIMSSSDNSSSIQLQRGPGGVAAITLDGKGANSSIVVEDKTDVKKQVTINSTGIKLTTQQEDKASFLQTYFENQTFNAVDQLIPQGFLVNGSSKNPLINRLNDTVSIYIALDITNNTSSGKQNLNIQLPDWMISNDITLVPQSCLFPCGHFTSTVSDVHMSRSELILGTGGVFYIRIWFDGQYGGELQAYSGYNTNGWVCLGTFYTPNIN